MKDKDIKNAFDQIKLDESSKSKMLENIYKDLDNNNQSELNKSKIVYLKHKKALSTIAASLVFVCGVYLYNQNMNTQIYQSPSETIQSPNSPLIEGDVRSKGGMIEDEFNNFDILNLKENATKIEFKSHDNYEVFKVITEKEFINNLLVELENINEKEQSDEILEKIGNSQATGNSITLSFITKDGLVSSIRVNLDLNIVCINGKYYDISSGFVQSIKNELKDITDFEKINTPPQN